MNHPWKPCPPLTWPQRIKVALVLIGFLMLMASMGPGFIR